MASNASLALEVRCWRQGEGGSGMRPVLVLLGCAVLVAGLDGSAAAQDGWPWTSYPSLQKKKAPAKRVQPRPPGKAESTEPTDTAALDTLTPQRLHAHPVPPQASPTSPVEPPSPPADVRPPAEELRGLPPAASVAA